MIIERLEAGDIPLFLAMAAAENWITDRNEPEFLLQAFPQGCLAARDDRGACIGFVTSIPHTGSGWIGNLLVAATWRGRGIGEKLFAAAVGALRDAGVATFWLTASPMGMRLYRKYGFTQIDTVERWIGTVAPDQNEAEPSDPGAESTACRVDTLAWGDRRPSLLAFTTARGRSAVGAEGFAILQPYAGRHQIGPFAALSPSAAQALLDSVIRPAPQGSLLCADAPASNPEAQRLYHGKGMKVCSTTALMYLGEKPAYRPELLYGLATMGSSG